MSTTDLVAALKELREREPAYVEAQQFYEGTVPEVAASAELRKLFDETAGDDYYFNFAKKVVTALVNRVEIATINVPGSSTHTKILDSIWQTTERAKEEPNVHLRACEYGDAYDYVTLDPNDPTRVKFVFHNPLCTIVIYDDDERTPKFVLKIWWEDAFPQLYEGKPFLRADLYYPYRQATSGDPEAGIEPTPEIFPHCEHYALPPTTASNARSDELAEDDWETFEDDTTLDTLTLPFFHYATELPYGEPVHKDAYGAQNAINKMLITQLTTSDSHGVPERYQLLEQGAELDQNTDDPNWADDEEAGDPLSPSATASSSKRSGPGTESVYTGTKAVGQFPSADPAVFTDPAELYISAMSVITDTPIRYFKPGGQNPSAASQQAFDEGFHKKIEHLCLLFGSTHRKKYAYALDLLNSPLGPDQQIAISWKMPKILFDAEFWKIAEIKIKHGVPPYQIFLEAGYTPTQLDEWGISKQSLPPPAPAQPAQLNDEEESADDGED